MDTRVKESCIDLVEYATKLVAYTQCTVRHRQRCQQPHNHVGSTKLSSLRDFCYILFAMGGVLSSSDRRKMIK
jgi:hypothetical protein